MSKVAENIKNLKSGIPTEVTLVAVSKTKPNEMILEGYQAGHLDYGENKVQDLVAKYEALPKDIHWHFIGHLQRNKVKYIAPFVHLIHGVDSEKLLREINKRAANAERRISVLLQVHIAEEESKFGLDKEELLALVDKIVSGEFPQIELKGLMGMATNTNDSDQVRKEFSLLKTLFDQLKSKANVDTLSMGMSGDYPLAIEAGSNMIRVGSKIFGERNY